MCDSISQMSFRKAIKSSYQPNMRVIPAYMRFTMINQGEILFAHHFTQMYIFLLMSTFNFNFVSFHIYLISPYFLSILAIFLTHSFFLLHFMLVSYYFSIQIKFNWILIADRFSLRLSINTWPMDCKNITYSKKIDNKLLIFFRSFKRARRAKWCAWIEFPSIKSVSFPNIGRHIV